MFFIPSSYFSFYQRVPELLGDGQYIGEVKVVNEDHIFCRVVGPGCSILLAHHGNIADHGHGTNSTAWITSDISVRMWRTVSAERSPRRKYWTAIGDDLLNFRKPLRILLWNNCKDFACEGFTGRAGSPDRRTGKQQVLQR